MPLTCSFFLSTVVIYKEKIQNHQWKTHSEKQLPQKGRAWEHGTKGPHLSQDFLPRSEGRC